eukprot:g2458.t1
MADSASIDATAPRRKIRGRRVDRALVLSFYSGKNFGDRLGVPILNSILPPHVEVTHAPLEPCPGQRSEMRCPVITIDEVRDANFDVVFVGTGMSMYRAALTDELFAILNQIPLRIGIFGTQYHESMPHASIRALVSLMDVWFARYLDDVRRYGDPRNTVHLGDWMIAACPLRRHSRGVGHGDTRIALYVPPNSLYDEVALDRYIDAVGAADLVFSGRLHPLLCSLSSAKVVAYAEQHEYDGTSGKFRSMLQDVFGKRNFPENTWIRVDRTCVVDYKRKISRQMQSARKVFETWTSRGDHERGGDEACPAIGKIRAVYYDAGA